jgi:hypothetical protein
MKQLPYFTIIIVLIQSLFVSCENDNNGNVSIKGEVTDESGNQIPDAKITIRLTEELPIISGPNGEFQFHNLVAGTYQLTVSAIGYQTYVGIVSVHTAEVTRVDIVLRQGDMASIAGFVRDKQTNKPISNATVQTVPMTNNAITDTSGRYELVNLEPRTYTVRVFARGYSVPESAVIVEIGKTTRTDFRLTKQESVQLSVTPSSLDFDQNSNSMTLTIQNIGSETLTWSITFPPEGWLTVIPTDGSTTDIPSIVSVTVDRTGFPDGSYDSIILITSNAGTKEIPVTMEVQW